ncbi:hypothetical protein AX17_003063 [Amanita inopinata Kibby_2008]|nr:hypothetical protein AX17_003063 [Amanita inopinata Kibby_2008]
MLRRSQKSWRNEYIARFKLQRRWENSRSSSISHVPLPSAISCVHLMPCQVVLSSSLKYGIVARSLPLKGKVLGGFLSAEGTANGMGQGVGLGIGNPNVEFAPNTSTCVLASKGGSASLLWGFRNGNVAVVLVDRVMNPTRITTELMRCKLHEEHEGAVSDSAWDDGAVTAVTGGVDGRVKLWFADPLKCIWTSEQQLQGLVPDACLKVATVMNQTWGCLAAALKSGEIRLWLGFELQETQVSTTGVRQIRIPCPLQVSNQTHEHPTLLPAISSFHMDASNESVSILIAYKDNPYFYRIRVRNDDGRVETITFGDPSFGPISSMLPLFATQPGEVSFVITGDFLGCISIYDWNASRIPDHPVYPVRKFEAHEDGSPITAITWNEATLMTGSARGGIHVWDGLTFTHLRSFVLHHTRRHMRHVHDEDARDEAIKQILIDSEKETFIASAGDRILAWQAGPAPLGSRGKLRARGGAANVMKRNRSGYAKYLEQLEMKETIKESRRIVEQENESYRRTFNREKEHRAKLQKLGLTESEVIEYVMMLSREEAMERGDDSANGSQKGETLGSDVFDDGQDNSFEVGSSRRADDEESLLSFHSSFRSSSPSPSGMTSDSGTPSNLTTDGQHPVARQTTDLDITPSPNLEEGPSPHSQHLLSSPPSFSPKSSPESPHSPGPASNEIHFPPIGTGASPTPSQNAKDSRTSGTPNSRLYCAELYDPSDMEHGTRVRDEVKVNANMLSGSVTNPAGMSWAGVAQSLSGSPGSPARGETRILRPVGAATTRYTGSNFHVNNDGEMDDDLRFALELSLAEARSRREA